MTNAPSRRRTGPPNQDTTGRTWLLWLAGALAFPIAGVAGTAVAGRVDDAAAALVGGTAAGLVLGAGQVLVSRRRLHPRRWIPATAAGMGVGLVLGAWTVGYGTSLPGLALMGALTGLLLGPAQALALPTRATHRWMWAAAKTPSWVASWDRVRTGPSAVSGCVVVSIPTRCTSPAPPGGERPRRTEGVGRQTDFVLSFC